MIRGRFIRVAIGVIAVQGCARAGAATDADDVAEIRRAWTAYLDTRQGPQDCGSNDRWLASEQGTWTTPGGFELPKCYDLAGSMYGVPDRYAIQRIERDGADYRIVTTIWHTALRLRTATLTVYAVRENGRWKLANALPRTTRDWHRATVGPITYVVAPELRFSRARADSAVVLADSIATAFGVPPLMPLTYYVVRDGDAMLRLHGFAPDTVYGGPGARAMPDMIISGDSVFAEKHGHEIAHRLLQDFATPNTTVIASEGVVTWLGGSKSRHYPAGQRALRAHLLANPAVTLDSLLASNQHDLHNHAAARLASMVHDARGVDGIRSMMNHGPSITEFRAGMRALLGRPWEEIAADWRAAVLGSGR